MSRQTAINLMSQTVIHSTPDPNHAARIAVDQPAPMVCLGLPSAIEWKRAELPIAGLNPRLSGTRLIHLSDLHLRNRWCRGYDDLIDRINQSAPDLLVITGDFVEDKRDYRPAWPMLRRFISPLRARLGIFGVLGNHDSDMLGVHLASVGVQLIEHRRILVGDGLELIGFPGVERIDLDRDFVDTLPAKSPSHARIALCHYPDLFNLVRPADPDLYLCGHTHGGQVCLPGGWPLLTHSRAPRRFARGIHRRDRTWFVVNRGLGSGNIPVRIFCPPEVMEIELVGGQADEGETGRQGENENVPGTT